MATTTLNWFPDRGFELDVEAADDEVAVRLVGVPVPADGTAELRRGVDLDRLDILFKASVEIQGEPAQLQDARVRLVSEDGADLLELDAHCEDVETGDVVPFKVALDIEVPKHAPETGGPRPTPTNEDDLDWEDETTLEQLVVNAPETPLAPERNVRTGGGGGNGQDGQAKGLQALLKALANLDDDEPHAAGADEPTARSVPREAPEPEDELPSDDPSDELRVPAEDHEDDEPEPATADQSLGAMGEARSLLELLVAGDHLELEGDLEALVDGVRQILALPLPSEAKATRLSEWLLDQPEVADLFVGDDELAEILERW